MPHRWHVDPVANEILWGEISRMPARLLDRPGGWVCDLGGGNGNFVSPLARSARLVSLDVDLVALRDAPRRGVRPVLGSALLLPIKDRSLDAVAGRAVLHHVPDGLDRALEEVRRAVKPGGLVLFQEPTDGNPIAAWARRRFPTERHDPHERPLPFEAYVSAIRRHFEVLRTEPFFLLSYLLPHLLGRLPPDRRRVARYLTRRMFAADQRLLAALPGLRRRAAYVSILARRPIDEPAARSG